jgi:hypothetical protein
MIELRDAAGATRGWTLVGHDRCYLSYGAAVTLRTIGWWGAQARGDWHGDYAHIDPRLGEHPWLYRYHLGYDLLEGAA